MHMMQQGFPPSTDVALADDGDWYGRRPPKDAKWLSRPQIWSAWATGALRPMYDLADERAERAARGWRFIGYAAFLLVVLGAATWAIWAGR
jgi:hypothetical protein